MRNIRVLLLMICAATLVSCKPNNFADLHFNSPLTPSIQLLVVGNGNNATMKVNTGAMNGCLNSNNGCMVFNKSERGNITFSMSGNDSGFHITEFKICMGATKPNPEDADCPLPIANALDFYIKEKDGTLHLANIKSGKIEWEYSDNVKTFDLHDRNLLPQTYYYLVTACNSAGHCPVADPIVDNKGIF